MNAHAAFEAFLTPPKTPPLSREARTLARAETFRVRLGPNGWARGGDAELQGYAWGDAAAGAAVLFVHGWGGHAGNHYAGIEAVVAAGGRAVAFDAPGHGRSEGVLSCAPAFAWAIEGVAAHVGPLRGIVAHSLGAAATCIALRRGVRAERAVLLAGACWVAPVLKQFTDRQGYPAELAEAAQRLAKEIFTPEESSAADNARELHGTRALVMHDPEDRDMPYEHSAAIAAAWPGAELVAVPAVGHFSILRSRDAVVRACAWVLGADLEGAVPAAG